jgi:hypothetical protein
VAHSTYVFIQAFRLTPEVEAELLINHSLQFIEDVLFCAAIEGALVDLKSQIGGTLYKCDEALLWRTPRRVAHSHNEDFCGMLLQFGWQSSQRLVD